MSGAKIITIDFETYYAKDFGFKTMTTEEYVRDPRFQIIGVSVKEDDQPAKWYSYQSNLQYHALLAKYMDRPVIAHNAMFDMAILNWQLGLKPKLIIDALSMARPHYGATAGGSLKALATAIGLGQKGTEVEDALGKRLEDFTPEELARYGEYCCNDADLTYALFKHLKPMTPSMEMLLIDNTIRMFTEPVLELNKDLLEQHAADVQAQKQKLLSVVDFDISDAMSNPKFAAVLTRLGVEPPMKTSPRTGKQSFAFGKTDKEFTDLLEHENPLVQAAVATRLGVKSTQEETRTAMFRSIAERGPLPVPLAYCGAITTQRWSGQDKINMQNLKRGGKLRKAIEAPKGHVVVVCDSSNIELRVNHTLAGQQDSVQILRDGGDLYCDFASTLFGFEVIKGQHDDERFLGKVCLSEETLVLCQSNGKTEWVQIKDVTKDHRLWDGKEWVCHSGRVSNGWKETLNLCGIWLTPDHLVLSGTDWKEAQEVVQDEYTLHQALATGAENLPSLGTLKAREAGLKRSLSNVIAGLTNTLSMYTTSKTLNLLDAISVRRKLLVENGIGSTSSLCRTTDIDQGILTDYPLPFPDATTPKTAAITTTEREEFPCVKSGGRTEASFLSTLKHCKVGMFRSLRLIGSTLTKAMSRATSDSYPGETTCSTKERSQSCNGASKSLSRNSHVYDILNCGPRNRFTVLTERGPIIVHNCHLGLGYGMSAEKFLQTLRIMSKGKVTMTPDRAEHTVHLWRSKYSKIPEMWKRANGLLPLIARGESTTLDAYGLVTTYPNGLKTLPNNQIYYPNLRKTTDGWVYDTKKFRTTVANKIYGGKVVENICQHLARNIIAEQLLKINSRYRVVMQVHDEVVAVVPEQEADEALDFMVTTMSTAPKWWAEIPLAAEGSYGKSYGDAK